MCGLTCYKINTFLQTQLKTTYASPFGGHAQPVPTSSDSNWDVGHALTTAQNNVILFKQVVIPF